MSLMLKMTKAIKEVPIEVKRLFQHFYPAFVSASNPSPLRDEVPVFMFHSVEAKTFTAQLNFLQKNNYKTLTLPDFMAFLKGEKQLEQPSVLLTFDDGHKSWYDLAFPLLKSYGFHAVGFLVPAYIREQPEPGSWLSWPEIMEMEQSGFMQFESHTTHHDQIFVAPQLIDFFHPGYDHNPLQLDTPWIDEDDCYTNRLRWGTPIYSHASRYAGRRRFYDDLGVRQACVTWVKDHGNENFFAQSGWRKKMVQFYKRAVQQKLPYRYETESEQRTALLLDLKKAQEMISQKLGRPVQHLCYPWGVGSDLAVALSREAGYASNFWVVSNHRNSNHQGDDPYYIPRLKDDYLMRLPGLSRQPLAEVFYMKMHRRSSNVNIY
jgi:peptidoglycan/xylan/chitin deacetylase (PgdA/CDA1 family)